MQLNADVPWITLILCSAPYCMVSFLLWGANFIKYVQRNPEMSSTKSFVGIQLHPNWLNACHLRFASRGGLSYNVWNDIGDLKIPINIPLKTISWPRFKSIISIWLLYARHYNPQLVYSLPNFWKVFLCFQGGFFKKFCPYVWLVFKSILSLCMLSV